MRLIILCCLLLAAGCAASSGSYVAVESEKVGYGALAFETEGTPREIVPRVAGVLTELGIRPPRVDAAARGELPAVADDLHGQVDGVTASRMSVRIDVSRSSATRSVVGIESKLPRHTQVYIIQQLQQVLSRQPSR